MKIGDKVVGYLNGRRIGALGTITGDYNFDETILPPPYSRVRRVRWDHKFFDGFYITHISIDTLRTIRQGQTVVEQDKNEYEEIEKEVLST